MRRNNLMRCCQFLPVLVLSIGILTGFSDPARADAPFFFIQLTDPQLGMFANNTNFTQETANLEFAVASINRLQPAFVVVTGDLVNRTGDAAQIREYQRIIAKVDRAIPLYNAAGNHDVGNTPSVKALAAYTNQFGADHYSFRHGSFTGIVLDASLIKAPENTAPLASAQEAWLTNELAAAKASHARHIVVFQHYPWFLKTPDEPDQYFNLPREQRPAYLALFHQYSVEGVFCGHYHRNVLTHDGNLEMVVTGALGKPLGGDQSGMQIVVVSDAGIQHRFFALGEIPNHIDLDIPLAEQK